MFHRVKSEVKDEDTSLNISSGEEISFEKEEVSITKTTSSIADNTSLQAAKDEVTQAKESDNEGVSTLKMSDKDSSPGIARQERLYSTTPANYESRSVSRYSLSPTNKPVAATSYNPYKKAQPQQVDTPTPSTQPSKEDTNSMTTNKTETTAKAADTSSSANYHTSPAYSGSSYPGSKTFRKPVQATTTTTVNSTAEGDRTLTIGRGITMSGEIESCDYLLVEGTVEAALKGARTLEIAESGVFYGTVEIDEASIAGRFEGDIMVGRLVVSATGSITGSITYEELEIETGAIIDGRLTPASAITKTQGSSSQGSSRTEAKATKEKVATQRPANSDAELFEDEAESAAE